jgi:uncharacterized protein
MKSRIITSQDEINAIIGKCQVCHVGMVDNEGKPYVLPFNFGYDEGVIYFHSSRHGKKIDILQGHPFLCVAFSTDYLLRSQNEDVACSYSMKYRSVLAYGKVEFIEDPDRKMKALAIIMKNYSSREFLLNSPSVREVNCWIMKVEKFECKVYGY